MLDVQISYVLYFFSIFAPLPRLLEIAPIKFCHDFKV